MITGPVRTRPRRHRRRPFRPLSLEWLERRTLLASGPRVTAITPTEVLNGTFDHIDATFDEPIDPATFTTDDVTLTGPPDVGAIAIKNVVEQDSTHFEIRFGAQTNRGTYQVAIGPNIADPQGNLMDQNQNGTGGEPGDSFLGSVIVARANAFVTTGTVTIGVGDNNFKDQDILIDGGTLVLQGPHQFHSIQLIHGGSLRHDPTSGGTDDGLDLTLDEELIADGGTITVGTLHSPEVLLLSGAVLTTPAATTEQVHKLDLEVSGDVVVGATSRIDVTGKGKLTGGYYAGGSYGGWGSNGDTLHTNPVYGDYADPDEPGSGVSNLLLPGGGLVRLTAGALALDGEIRADGAAGGDGDGGSGGGIYIDAATLTGSGSIRAAGGDGDGGGGGGRVAVYAKDFTAFDTAAITAPGGQVGRSPGGAGTVYLRDTDELQGTLIFDSGSGGNGWSPLGLPAQDNFVIPDAIVIRGGRTRVRPEHGAMAIVVQGALKVEQSASLTQVDGRLTVQGEMKVTGGALLEGTGAIVASGRITVDGTTLSGGSVTAPTLSVVDGGVLTSPSPTTSSTTSLILNVSGTLSVDSSSRIDVTGKGKLTGGYYAGGSYGGLGGGGTTNPVYGDYADPDEPGSGVSNLLLPGGGLVRLTAGALALDGEIRADGAAGGDGDGGSGGGIYIDAATLTGSGSIRAAGGDGDGGGGGGRVAVYAKDFTAFDTAAITAPGGQNGRFPGGAGSVWIVQGRAPNRVRTYSPIGQNGGRVTSLDTITLTFNRPIDTSTFASIFVDGQMGHIQASGLTQVGDTTYRLDLPVSLTEDGPYHVTILPTLLGADGFPLDQNANGIQGEPDDGYTFNLTLDTVPPRVTTQSPAGDVAGTIDHVDVWFSEAIDATTFTTADATIIKPDGTAVAATSIQDVGLNRFRIGFPAQTLVGTYHIKIGPNVTDLAGNGLEEDGDGTGGEATDVYDGTFNLVDVDLGLNSVQVQPGQLWAGEAATISWSGRNLTGASLQGNWVDSVYFSVDGQWDINDPLLATVPHTGGLAQGQTYSSSASVVLPGVLPGTYHILVRADVVGQEKEGPDRANNLADSGPIAVVVHPLGTDGAAASGTVTTDDPSDYYAIHVDEGENLVLVLQEQGGYGASALYVRLNAIPTPQNYTFLATGGSKQIATTAPPGGGTYYVMVRSSDRSQC